MSARPLALRSHTHWLLLIGALGGLARLGFALLPLSQHLLLLEDDAWMVTAIARNWALGRGITADGLNPTNGFHPLYTLTLGALPYLVAPNRLDAGFMASLVICALLATLALWPLYRLACHLAGPTAAVIAAALYALNPMMIRLTVNGMETALALLLCLITLWAVYTLDLSRPRGNLLLAALTAAAILARLDAALLFAAIAGARLIWTWHARRLRAELPGLVTYVAVTFALLGPYFWRNWIVFGALAPSSGTALAYMHSYRGQFALSNGLQAVFDNSAIAADWISSRLAAVILLILGVVGLWYGLGRDLLRALPLLLYLPLPPLYYGYSMQQSNPRYYVTWSSIILILLAWALAKWLQRRPTGRRRGVILAGVTCIMLLNTVATAVFWATQRSMPQLTQPTSYQAALWIRDYLPSNAIIGAKNSGIYQYYSGHIVVNIDGKLNHEIVPAMEQRRLLAYLRAKGVKYLVDRQDTLADHIQFYSAEFGPAPFHRLPSTAERLRIYGALVLSALRLGPPPALDRRDGFRPNRSFTEVAPVIATFQRPNERANPVVIVELQPETGKQPTR